MALAMTPTTAAAMGSVPSGQGRSRLGRAEQHAPGRRLARDRHHGRDRRLATITVEPTNPGAQAQFVEGFQTRCYVAAAIAFVGAVVAVVTVRKTEHAEAPAVLEARR